LTTFSASRQGFSVESAIAPIAVLLALSLPAWVENKFLLFLATQAGVYMIVAMGLNFVSGYAGQTSLAQGALTAVGAYTAAIVMLDGHASFWIAALAAVVSTTLVGSIMALPALRLSAWYFALISLTFAQVVGDLIVEWRSITRGFSGIVNIPRPSLFGHSFSDKDLYLLVVVVVIAMFLVLRNLIQSRIGRAMVAVRDNPLAAMASGASLLSVKMFAFGISAALAGLGGALYAVQKTVISVDDFAVDFSIFFLLIIVVGGSGRLWGPIVGTLVFFLVPETLGALQSWRVLVYGVALLLLMLFAPNGVVGALESAWRRHRPAGRSSHRELIEQSPIEGARLEVRDIKKRFGGIQALDGAALSVDAGATHAVVGPNGSGKTTLLNMICGFFRVDAGLVHLGQSALLGRKPHAIARLGVGRTFQTPKLLGGMTVLDNVLLGAYASERASIVEIALRLPRARREDAELRSIAMHYLTFVGLASRAFDLAGDIPHGQQRLLEIARVLIGRPRLLLLDEPAAGLSMVELDRLGELVRSIAKLGTTVVIVEHHLELVGEICDNVTVLERGRVLALGTPVEVFSNPEVMSAYMGRTAKELTS
jgi:branched-chain amino acid transport system permease protein